MKRDNRIIARDISAFWSEYVNSDTMPADCTMEGAAQFAIAHAILALAHSVDEMTGVLARNQRKTDAST